MTNFTPHHHQKQAHDNVLADWKHYRSSLISMATGTGKTVTFLYILDTVMKSPDFSAAIIMAHTDHLVTQPLYDMMDFFPHMAPLTGLVTGYQKDFNSKIILGSVQTLKNHTDKLPPISHLIIDETHHARADTYGIVIDALPDAKILGVTATHKRSDSLSLMKIFDKFSFKYSIIKAINDGILVPFKAFGFALPLEFEVTDKKEDTTAGDLLSADNIMEIVFQKWQELAGDRLTFAFTSSVAQAHAYAYYFSKNGIPSKAVSGATKKPELKNAIESFKAGEIQVLFNCQILTEGTNVKQASCFLNIKPTKSDVVYVQMLGRVLRTAENKPDALVLDFAPSNARDIVMAGDVLDDGKKRSRGENRAESSDVTLIGALAVSQEDGIGTIEPDDVAKEVLDLMGKNKLAWTFDNVYLTATISQSVTTCIVVPERDRVSKADSLRREGKLAPQAIELSDWINQYRVYSIDGYNVNLVGCSQDLKLAKGLVDSELGHLIDSRLARKREGWRNKPMTSGQADFLNRLGLFESGISRGESARIITHAVAVEKVRKSEQKRAKRILNRT